MDLTTRCPKCGTVFQASLSDLQLRKGYIRCVQCSHIFDGYAEVVQDLARGGSVRSPSPADPEDYLGPDVSRPDTGPVLEPPAAGPIQNESAPHVIRAGRPASQGAARARPEFTVGVAPWPDDGRSRPAAWDEPHVGFGAAPVAGDEPADWADVPASPASPEAIVVEAHPGYRGSGGSAAALLDRDPESRGAWSGMVRFLGWLLLGLLGVAFVAQLAYVYRGQIAQFAPQVRPWLEQACGPLHCRVPYARNIGQISVTGSALQVADAPPGSAPPPAAATRGTGAGTPQPIQHFVLQVTLRNQLDRPQEWPTLVLDLKDGSGALLVRRNLSPAEYLGPAMTGRPFAASSEALLRIPLALEGVRINGYQLDLFFP